MNTVELYDTSSQKWQLMAEGLALADAVFASVVISG